MATNPAKRGALRALSLTMTAILVGTAFVGAPAAATTTWWTGIVPGIGTPVLVLLPLAGTYDVTVSGTYTIAQGQSADASKVNTFGPCSDFYPQFNPDPRIHDLTFDGGSPWTASGNPSLGPNYKVTKQSPASCDPTNHVYTAKLLCSPVQPAAGCTVVLRIWDNNYLDNSGWLNVVVSQ